MEKKGGSEDRGEGRKKGWRRREEVSIEEKGSRRYERREGKGRGEE